MYRDAKRKLMLKHLNKQLMLKPNCHDAKQRMLKQKQAGC
jgi:hypothetical protein